ncbi:MAG: cell division protein FtsQ [Prevotella sp.]|uniref:cell division protein FtsQ n=1 Tax=Prevotella sp. TaxID=59823 RepID=UPI002A262714|nr:cell division protein FtsQ [Prevotella sp.]MDD7318568.1 cell division protein FtsQ [Prevotellaceae bacterium]MDY4020369.1 cell division protein FtsQ [Prevotella sp.]
MKVHINVKKTIIATLDVLLAIYLGFAFTSFNEPANPDVVCQKCNIMIADENTNGFLKADDVKRILVSSKMMPVNKKTGEISTRSIEEKLKSMAFVKTAQCFKAENGDVTINITQRLPLLRVKSEKGDDYYIDERGGVMPNSNYVSDLIIATGNIDRRYAADYLMPMTETLMDNELWQNLFEQINVTEQRGIELVPRVGDHIVFIGQLPAEKNAEIRKQAIVKMLETKLSRLEKFYKYGISKAGWNRYDYINLEFDNQIICHYRRSSRQIKPETAEVENTVIAKPDSVNKEKKTNEEKTAPRKEEKKVEKEKKEVKKEKDKKPEKKK